MAQSVDPDTTLAKLVAHETDPLTALATLGTTRQALDRLTQVYVTCARRPGASWTEIGAALGVTKQAWEGYGRLSGNKVS